MLLIMGCTASGKSRLAFEMAKRLNGEILSIDSMKVYRRMDIGTAKPPKEQRQQIRHHLIDVVEPSESFSLGQYIERSEQVIESLIAVKRPIIAAGGTAMYIRGLLEGIFDGPPAHAALRQSLKEQAEEHGTAALHERLKRCDPQSAQRIHPNDLKRIIRALEVMELTGKPISSFQTQFRSGNYRWPWTLIALRRDREDAAGRINRRVKQMVAAGLIDEVQSLLAEPAGLSEQAAQAVGYAEIIDYLAGKRTQEQAVEQIKINTRRFAKSQRTWFRSFTGVHWLDLKPDDTVPEVADRLCKKLDGD